MFDEVVNVRVEKALVLPALGDPFSVGDCSRYMIIQFQLRLNSPGKTMTRIHQIRNDATCSSNLGGDSNNAANTVLAGMTDERERWFD